MNPSPQNAIIFGASGQDGYYLSNLLKAKNIEVIKVSRSAFHQIDIGSFDSVKGLIKHYKPNYIFHLAATSSLNDCYLQTNKSSILDGTFNILESLRIYNLSDTKVFFAGSIYQFQKGNKKINERSKLTYDNHYSLFRNLAKELVHYYRKQFNFNLYYGFLAHHDSPIRKDKHLTRHILEKLVNEKNNKIIFEFEDSSIQKEFNHSLDVCKAILDFINQSKYHEVVIGSGNGYSIKEFTEKASEIIGATNVTVLDKNENSFMSYVTDPALLKKISKPFSYDLNKLILDLIG